MGFDMIARIGADISDFSRKMAAVRTQLGVFSSFKGGLIGAGTLMAPSVIPMIAALGASAVALGGSFAAAGAGVATFGAVAIPTLGKIFETQKSVEEAQKKLNEATTEKEKEKALKELEAAYAGLSDKQREAVKNLQDFKSFWGSFAKEFENPVLDIFSGSLIALRGVLEPLKPTISETAAAFSKLLDMFNQGLNAQPVKDFFTFLGETAYDRTINFGMIFGNVMRGIMALIIAFDPIAVQMEKGLVNMSKAFATWAEGLGKSTAFETFIQYIKTNGPVMLSVIGNIISIIKELAFAFAPFGQAALAALEGITGFVAGLLQANPALGSTIATLTMFVGASMVASAAFFKITDAVGVVGDIMKKAGDKTTMLGRALAFLVSPVGLTIAAILALIGIFIYFYKTNETFRNTVIGAWNAIKETAIAVFGFLQPFIQKFIEGFKQFGAAIKDAFSGDFSGLAEVFTKIAPMIIGALLGGLPSIIMAAARYLPAIVEGIQSNLPMIMEVVNTIIQNFITFIGTALPQLIQAGVQILTMLINGIVQNLPMIVNAVLQLITFLLNAFVQYLPLIINAGIQILVALINGIIQMLPQLIQLAVTIITELVNLIVQNLPLLIDAGIKILMSLIEGIIQILPQLIDAAIQLIDAIVNALIDNLPQIIAAGIEILNALIDGIIQVLPQLIAAALELIRTIAEAIIDNLPQIIAAGVQILDALIEGILQMIWGLASAISNDVINTITEPLNGLDLSSIGVNIIQGLIDGIGSMAGSVISKIQEVAGGVKETMMSMLGIHSPSTWMRDMIGENMILGWIKGIEGMKQSVMGTVAAMTDWMKPDLSNIQLGYNVQTAAVTGTYGVSLPANSARNQVASETVNLERMFEGANIVIQGDYDVKRMMREAYEYAQSAKRRRGNR